MRLLAEHGEDVEADLLRFATVDWLDVGSERLSWRRLGSLIRRLPRESHTARALHGEIVEFGNAEHLLATIADLLALGNWQRSGNKRTPKPPQLWRPGARPSRYRTGLTPTEMKARLLAQQRRRRRR